MSVSLPQPSHITRQDGIYYYRRRLSCDLRGGKEAAISLRTRHFREAEFLAETINRAFDGALARAEAAVTAESVDLNAILRACLNGALVETYSGGWTDQRALPFMPIDGRPAIPVRRQRRT